jgi:histidinol-phosphatase
MPSGFTDDLRLAHVLADDADSLTMSRFRAADLHVATKADMTPVSDADHAVEDVLRRTLGRARPRDAVVGEEQGSSGWGPRRWVIDPIDGTKSFVRGVPVWATLIALMIDDAVVVGCISAPALGRRWWASLGTGASTGKSLTSAQRCRVSDVSDLAQASFSYSTLTSWESVGRLDAALALSRRCWQTRGYGDFWSHLLVAEGAVDIAAEPQLALHDMAALSIVVEEAGGRFTDLAGRPGPLGAGAVSTNSRLHEEALAFLGEREETPAPGGGDAGRVGDLSARRNRRDSDER